MTTPPVQSEFLQARQIVHVRVAAERLSGWTQEEGSDLLQRTGQLQVEIIGIFKGNLDASPGETVQIGIVERGTGSARVMDFYGIWAHVSTSPGTELVAFCDGAASDLQSALTDEHCERLVPAESVLSDLELVSGLEKSRLTADALLAEALRHQSRGGGLFARYIWARTRNAVVGSPERFNALMRIAEDPRTSTEAQETYLAAAYEDATFTEELPSEQRGRLTRSMFRAALNASSGELRDILIGTFIPNVVEADAPDRLSVGAVFGDQVELAQQVAADAEDPQTSAYPQSLRSWLSGEAEG